MSWLNSIPAGIASDQASRPRDEPAENEFLLGLDLGQVQDFTALAVVERVEAEDAATKPPRYEVRHLERPPLGTGYPQIAARVGEVLRRLPSRPRRPRLVVDATGVGRPVVDMLRQSGLEPIAITITAGDTPSWVGGGWRVPKRDLVSTLAVLLQTGRLKVAKELPDAATLVNELLNFRVKISVGGHDSYEAWREGVHDDLVLAVSLAVWYGERPRNRPRIWCL